MMGKHSTYEALMIWIAWREERTRAEIAAQRQVKGENDKSHNTQLTGSYKPV